jgi:hypothetical protein
VKATLHQILLLAQGGSRVYVALGSANSDVDQRLSYKDAGTRIASSTRAKGRFAACLGWQLRILLHILGWLFEMMLIQTG